LAFCTDPPFMPECRSMPAVDTSTSKATAPRRPVPIPGSSSSSSSSGQAMYFCRVANHYMFAAEQLSLPPWCPYAHLKCCQHVNYAADTSVDRMTRL
jgi:hypothetical protein